jgi:hypothetical protein
MRERISTYCEGNTALAMNNDYSDSVFMGVVLRAKFVARHSLFYTENTE